MRRLVTATAVVASLVVAPVASADKPLREGLPAEPFTLDASICGFPVDVGIVANKEFITTFSSGKQIITGKLVVELSGNGKTITEQISGPGFITTDQSGTTTLTLSGTSLVFFFPGDLGPGIPGQLLLTRGPVTLVFPESGTPSFDRTSASVVDLCAVLADP
jgi:hypothetical protein